MDTPASFSATILVITDITTISIFRCEILMERQLNNVNLHAIKAVPLLDATGNSPGKTTV